MKDSFHTTSVEQTYDVARHFAERLKRGDVVALYGELGSGKTQFVKGICDRFGVHAVPTSPTFVLFNCYHGNDMYGNQLMIYHFDLYRITSLEELYEIGYEEFFYGNGICCIEWAEHGCELLPQSRYDVQLSHGEKENERTITIERREK